MPDALNAIEDELKYFITVLNLGKVIIIKPAFSHIVINPRCILFVVKSAMIMVCVHKMFCLPEMVFFTAQRQ